MTPEVVNSFSSCTKTSSPIETFSANLTYIFFFQLIEITKVKFQSKINEISTYHNFSYFSIKSPELGKNYIKILTLVGTCRWNIFGHKFDVCRTK